MQKRTAGYTLVVVAALMVAAATAAMFTLQRESATSSVDRSIDIADRLITIEEAITRYRSSTGNYPCPAPLNVSADDTVTDYGLSANCADVSPPVGSGITDLGSDVWRGMVPTQTLGLSRDYSGDNFGNKILYAVHKDLNGNDVIALHDTSDTLIENTAFVVYSLGSDNYGAWGLYSTSETTACPASSTLDRFENCDTDTVFRLRPLSTGASVTEANYYDDSLHYPEVPPEPPEFYATGERDRWQYGDSNMSSTPSSHNTPQGIAFDGFDIDWISAGGNAGCILADDGNNYCWGQRNSNVLGCDSNCDPAYFSSGGYNRPQLLDTGQVFEQIKLGNNYSCGLNSAGAVFCWGNRGPSYNRLGNPAAAADQATPLAISSADTFSSIMVDSFNSCAIRSADNQAYCWGLGQYYMLGNNSTSNQDSPTAVSGGIQFFEIAAASTTGAMCGISIDGKIYCWGRNEHGVLGINEASDAHTEQEPIEVPSAHSYVSITSGFDFFCALRTDRRVDCWGRNNESQLADGSTTTRRVPTQSTLTNMVQIDAAGYGERSACGVNTNEDVICWGQEDDGEFGVGGWGLGSPTAGMTLSEDAAYVSMGFETTLVRPVGSGADCSGSVNFGSCTGNTLTALFPDRSETYAYDDTGPDVGRAKIRCEDGTWEVIHSSCGVPGGAGGPAYSWGRDGSNGQSGNGPAFTDTPFPSTVHATLLGTDVTMVGAGGTNGCALNAAGQAYCWGNNASGRTGRGTWNSNYSTPQLVTGGITWTAVTSGRNAQCGLNDSGRAYCWGEGYIGGIGNGSYSDRNAPIAVNGSLEYTSIYSGMDTVCAIRPDASARCWGRNTYGELGRGGGSAHYATPQTVIGGLSWAEIEIGEFMVCGVTTSGAGHCWGRGDNYGLGYGSTAHRNSPGAALPGTWTTISPGQHFSCGVRTNGDLYCWGRNDHGRTGRGLTSGFTTTPTKIGGTRKFIDVSAGSRHACAIDTSYDAYCWGLNSYGATGRGTTSGNTTTPQRVNGTTKFITVDAALDHTVAIEHTGSVPTTCSASQVITWTVGANTCSVAAGATDTYGDAARSITDATPSDTGSAQIICNSDGLYYLYGSGETCTNSGSAPCPAGGFYNYGSCTFSPIPYLAHGASDTVYEYGAYYGHVTITCNNGIRNYSGQHCESCFIDQTLVTMADGSKKTIMDLVVGDKVRGKTGVNTVETIRVIPVEERIIYGFNGGEKFVTAGHPFHTKTGWKAIDPEKTSVEGHTIDTSALQIGDEILREDGSYFVIQSIESEVLSNSAVYNPSVSGDQTYYADGYLVHNK